MEGGKFHLEAYLKHYKKFLFVPFIILLIALSLIVVKYQATGEFINKDISLKGGISLTVLTDQDIALYDLQQSLAESLSPYEVSIRTLNSAGGEIGVIIESDIPGVDENRLNEILQIVGNALGKEISEEDYSFERMGSSLGQSFFNQTIRALVLAFVFMGIVVFIYFRSFVPSAAVILSALSDIVVTVAIINLMGIKLGTAGIAALLMLVGYSIDTDIMLTTRMLKRKGKPMKEALFSAFKTGMTMTLTTLAAVTIALVFSQSDVIRQIMTILLIGLIIDMLYTWVQNSGLLIWYLERKR